MASLFQTRNLAAFLGFATLACESALAQNPNYAPGDLVLFFQKEGSTNTVYASLGNAATTFRGPAAGPDGTNQVNFLNINAELTAAFGAGWASDPSIYAGLAGVWGTSGSSTVLQNGDPHRTIYISTPRSGSGTVGAANSTAWDMALAGNTAMTNGASGITSMNNVLETIYSTAVAVSPTSTSLIDEQNPVSGGVQGNAFQNNFAGGVQQVGSATSWGSFGGAGTVEFALDLYRILARSSTGSGSGQTFITGQVDGPQRLGSYEGTITVNSSGQVSFISQGAASSAFDTWMNTFTSITNAPDKLPTADPDQDGFTNLMEFVLNGDPSQSSPSIAPSLDASGSDFVFNFSRRDDSESEVTEVFQYSNDLSTWTDVAVGASSGTVGSATITVSENAGAADAISVSVPKSVSPSGKLFGRIKAIH